MILAINWTEAQIEEIVKKVVIEMNGTPSDIPAYDAESYGGRKFIGIFEDMNDAIEAANAGYRAIRSMRVEEREKLITSIRELIHKEADILGALGVAETKMGRVAHKIAKHHLVADKTPGTEDIVSSENRRLRSDSYGDGAFRCSRKHNAEHEPLGDGSLQ